MKGIENQSQAGRSILLGISIVLILSLIMGAFPQPAVAASQEVRSQVTCKFKYKVQPGDTLIYIGQLYQIDWREIAKANKLTEPYILTPGQVLCIPGGTEPGGPPSKTTTKGKARPVLKVVPYPNSILVSVENFPPRVTYYIRVFPRSSQVSYRLGYLTTNKEGDFTGFFNWHLWLPRTPEMALCLKNVWTDAVSCVKYDDPYYYIPRTIKRCSRTGR